MTHDEQTEDVADVKKILVDDIENALVGYGRLSVAHANHTANRLVSAGYTGWSDVRDAVHDGVDLAATVNGIGAIRRAEVERAVHAEDKEVLARNEREAETKATAAAEIAELQRGLETTLDGIEELVRDYQDLLSAAGKMIIEEDPRFTFAESRQLHFAANHIHDRQANVPEENISNE